MVPRAGIEPARTYNIRGILSPLCLPVSPPRQLRRRPDSNWWMTVLQTAPLPLGYDAKKSPSKKRGLWAKERIRTVDPHVGNVMLYQLSYFRNTYHKKNENNIMSISKLNQEFYLWLWPLCGSGNGPKRSVILFLPLSIKFKTFKSSFICLSREYFLNEK